jgi:CHASE1-domain containing sensor protein
MANPSGHYEDIFAMAYAQKITLAERAAFETEAELDGFMNFSIRDTKHYKDLTATSKNRSEYYVVKLIEPFNPITAQVIGIDLLSDAYFSRAINKAVSTGKLAIIHRYIDPSRPSYFIFFPNISALLPQPHQKNVGL